MIRHTIVILLFLFHICYELSAQEIARVEQELVLRELHSRANSFLSKYSGTISRRKVTNYHYNPDTGELVSKDEILVERKEYTNRKPEVRALEYMKNGILQDNASYKPPLTEPPFPLFGDIGAQNYEYFFLEKGLLNGKVCYQIQVNPRRHTDRHLRAVVWIDVDSKRILRVKGTLAKLPFGAKSLDLDIFLKANGEFNVESHGTVRYLAKVPMIIHDRVVNEFFSLDEKFIPR